MTTELRSDDTSVSSTDKPLIQPTMHTMFSTVGSAGIVDPGSTAKVVFSNSTVQLATGDGVLAPSRLTPQASATIRFPISPADMPQVQVQEMQLNINYRLGNGRVEATLWEVAYWLHPAGVVSEAALLKFTSDGDDAGIQTPNEFVSSAQPHDVVGPTTFPPGNHVCDSTKNAYYITLTLTQPGPERTTPPVLVAPAVSAMWITNVG
jgi:hypothetical protein